MYLKLKKTSRTFFFEIPNLWFLI